MGKGEIKKTGMYKKQAYVSVQGIKRKNKWVLSCFLMKTFDGLHYSSKDQESVNLHAVASFHLPFLEHLSPFLQVALCLL